jgi:hypothetical protein
MKLLDLGDLYPDTEGLCATLFVNATKTSGQAKRGATAAGGASCGAADSGTMRDVATLAQLPDAAFLAVVAHHAALPRVLVTVLDDIAGARSHRLDAAQFNAFATVLLRICGEIEGSADGQVLPHPGKLASRLAKLLPADCLPALALCLLRSGPARGSVALTSLLIQAPSLLLHLKGVGSTWCDGVHSLAVAVTDEARKGRFQRLPTDTLALAERAHRLAKQLWSLLHACPFAVDYIAPLPRLIASLRVVADTIAPLLQHAVMTSDVLAPRRPALVRAMAATANAAADAAEIALIFASAHDDSRRVDCRMLSGNADEHLGDTLAAYGPVVVRRCLGAEGSPAKLLYQLASETSANSADASGNVLAAALNELEPARAGAPSVHIFAERVLTGLSQRGVMVLETDLQPAVAASVAAKRKQTAKLPVGNMNDTSRAGAAGSAAVDAAPLDATARMVLDVMPHYNPAYISEALALYDGSAEMLLDAAMMSNLPPHIEAKLTSAQQPQQAQTAAAPSSAQAEPSDDVPREGLDAIAGAASVFDLLQLNFAQRTGDDGDDDDAAAFDESEQIRSAAGAVGQPLAAGGEQMVPLDRGSSDYFALDDALKATILAMAAGDLYDDERDDGEDDFVRGRANTVEEFDRDDDVGAATAAHSSELQAVAEGVPASGPAPEGHHHHHHGSGGGANRPPSSTSAAGKGAKGAPAATGQAKAPPKRAEPPGYAAKPKTKKTGDRRPMDRSKRQPGWQE